MSVFYQIAFLITFTVLSLGGQEEPVQTVPAEPVPNEPKSFIDNPGFEFGNKTSADGWRMTHSQPPVRSDADAHTGSFSVHSSLLNTGSAPSEGHLSQSIDGKVIGGLTYEFSFWVKQVGPGKGGYIQQYQLQWFDREERVLKGTDFHEFFGTIGKWQKISVPNLAIPENAEHVRILFRFVTGAIEGGSGDVFIDDIAITSYDSKDAIAAAIERKIDQAQFGASLRLISNFMKRFPDDPRVAKFQILQKRLQEFEVVEEQEAGALGTE